MIHKYTTCPRPFLSLHSPWHRSEKVKFIQETISVRYLALYILLTIESTTLLFGIDHVRNLDFCKSPTFLFLSTSLHGLVEDLLRK